MKKMSNKNLNSLLNTFKINHYLSSNGKKQDFMLTPSFGSHVGNLIYSW